MVANTFLAYIIGIDEVLRIATEPVQQNLTGFIAMILFSGAFYFVFSWLREQVCIAICPYGRMQGVLLDKNSIVVAYDYVRGEPRTRIRKGSGVTPKSSGGEAGDCIDCNLCVKVCPTGIDIRNGVQLECVNCTACIDACNEVMTKVDRPKNLIRYDSLNGIASGSKRIFTPRVMAYTGVLAILIVVQVLFLLSRADVETLLLRTPGMLYQEVDNDRISNLYNYQIINKTKDEFPITFKLISHEGTIRFIGQTPVAKGDQVTEGAVFIEIPEDELSGRKTTIRVEVYSGEEILETIKTNFLGPVK